MESYLISRAQIQGAVNVGIGRFESAETDTVLVGRLTPWLTECFSVDRGQFDTYGVVVFYMLSRNKFIQQNRGYYSRKGIDRIVEYIRVELGQLPGVDDQFRYFDYINGRSYDEES